MAKREVAYTQVPVINKTEGLFARDPNDSRIVLQELSPEIKELRQKEPHVFTVKKDGTCAIIVVMGKNIWVMRRQDIKVGARNYDMVMKSGQNEVIAGVNCFVTKMNRGSDKVPKIVPLYIFQLDETGKPEPEFGHIIGFTPLLHDFGDDKYAITTIKGVNGNADMQVYTTLFDGSLDVHVDWVPVAELMGSKLLMTVEIMGSKISNKYGFTSDQHIISPHGSIVFPLDNQPPVEYNELKAWFENDDKNRWANVEGFVIHFPKSNRRIKVHRGHVGLEHTWRSKKESGIKFVLH